MQKRFWNLDGFRFMAAWVVLVCHVEIFKPFFGIKPIGWRFFTNSAQMAVTFFFVLSGFLITWLLLKEKMASPVGKISITRFYRKRIARIWPLYYLLVFLTFFIFKKISFLSDFTLQGITHHSPLIEGRLIGYSLFMPNYTGYKYGYELYLGQTWSLGVEEFFYLLFPLALFVIKLKHFRSFLIIITLVFLALSIGIHFTHLDETPSFKTFFSIFLDRYRIYSFALGALAATYVLQKPTGKSATWKLLSNKKISAFLLFILLLLVAGGVTFSIATQQLYSFYFSILIISVISSQIKFALLNKALLVYLGKISYGIYMLHPLGIVIIFKLLNAGSMNPNSVVENLLLFGGATLITLLLAAISYEFFEKYFLLSGKGKRTDERKKIIE